MKNDWDEYSITGASDKNASEFTRVYHVTHFPAAKKIVEESRVRTQLVSEGRLRDLDCHAVWLTANTFDHIGSAFGCVRFAFDWADLVKGKELFWVESILRAGLSAYRILLTGDLEKGKKLKRLSLSKDSPVVYDETGERWFFRKDKGSEFVIDEDLDLSRSCAIEFLDHKRDLCVPNGSSCHDFRLGAEAAGQKFMAILLSSDILPDPTLFQEPGSSPLVLRHIVSQAVSKLLENITKGAKYSGQSSAVRPTFSDLGKTIFRAYAKGDNDKVHRLISSFRNKDEFIDIARRIAVTQFQLNTPDKIYFWDAEEQ